jgi:hypothetical protein
MSSKLSELVQGARSGIWVVIAMLTLGYIFMGSFYVTTVGLSSTYNSTALGVPRYELSGNKVTFAAAGKDLPLTLGGDLEWVVPAVDTATIVTVNIYEHTLGMIWAVAAVYLFPFVYLAMDPKNRLRMPLQVSTVMSVVYTIALIIVWNIVHPDLMYILGNDDKIAHWLVTCGLVAQAGLYHATEHNLVKSVGTDVDTGVDNAGAAEAGITVTNSTDRKKMLISIPSTPSILFFAFIIGSYLYSVVMGVSMFMPVNASGFSVLPESYQAVFAIYATHQTVEFARFLATLMYPMIKADAEGNMFKSAVGLLTGPGCSVFLHVWLLVLVGVFAFFPRTVIMQAGKI